ncbi:hypothetical protein SLA2020_356180 [Shorea laevis]
MICLISWSPGNCVVGSVKEEQPPNFPIIISLPKPKLNLTTLSCKLSDRFHYKDSFALSCSRSCFLVPTLNIPKEIKSQKVLKLGGMESIKEEHSLN